MKLKTIIRSLEELSPLHYAEDWDNVGLLLGDEEQEITHIMVALDASDYVIEQAIKSDVDLLLTHHPMIFRAVKQVNTGTLTGRKIWNLATHRIASYAMHTNFDVKGGMAELAERKLDLQDARPLIVTTSDSEETEGLGRIGRLPKPMTVKEIAQFVKKTFDLENVMSYGDINREVSCVAVLPGSGKSMIEDARQAGAELFITGDIGHHEGMDALDMGLSVLDVTHYGLEHIFISFLTEYLEHTIRACTDEGENIQITGLDTGGPMTVL